MEINKEQFSNPVIDRVLNLNFSKRICRRIDNDNDDKKKIECNFLPINTFDEKFIRT